MGNIMATLPVLSGEVLNKMDSWDHFLLILLAAVAAFIPRYFPILFFSKRKIPSWFNEWMKYVPVSLFTALVVKDLFISDTYSFALTGNLTHVFATVVVILIAYFTRSMSLSVVVGLVAVFALTFI